MIIVAFLSLLREGREAATIIRKSNKNLLTSFSNFVIKFKVNYI
jgi:hypothetical protein